MSACKEHRARLGEFLVGALDPRASGEVEKHIEGCGECSAELAELQRLEGVLWSAEPERVVKPGVRRIAVAAAALLAVGIAGVALVTFTGGVLALSPDQRTLFCLGSGVIQRYDLPTHAQLPDYMGPFSIFASDFALLPPFDGSGGAIVGSSSEQHRYDSSGALIQVYDLPNFANWRGISLDPDGTSYWTIGRLFGTSPFEVYRFDIDSGAVVAGPFPTGMPNVVNVRHCFARSAEREMQIKNLALYSV